MGLWAAERLAGRLEERSAERLAERSAERLTGRFAAVGGIAAETAAAPFAGWQKGLLKDVS